MRRGLLSDHVHDIGAPACLSAEPLAGEFCDIGLVIDDQNAEAHGLFSAPLPLPRRDSRAVNSV
jgi:hypothetical protein